MAYYATRWSRHYLHSGGMAVVGVVVVGAINVSWWRRRVTDLVPRGGSDHGGRRHHCHASGGDGHGSHGRD